MLYSFKRITVSLVVTGVLLGPLSVSALTSEELRQVDQVNQGSTADCLDDPLTLKGGQTGGSSTNRVVKPGSTSAAKTAPPTSNGSTTQTALGRFQASGIDVGNLPPGYAATYDNNGMLTGLSKDGVPVATMDNKGNLVMSDKAKADLAKDQKSAASQTDTAADCQKRGGTMQADGTCTCPKGSTMGKDGVCVEEQRSWWDKLTDWVGNNAVALMGIALGVAGLLMSMRKDKSKKSKKTDEETPVSPVTPEDLRGSEYGSVTPSYGRSGTTGTGSTGTGSTGTGNGSGGGSGSGGEQTDEQKAQESTANKEAAGDGAIAAYTYAKKNLDAADAFPKQAEAISEQIDDAQTWRDAFQAVINADYTTYAESARFLTLLAAEGSQKSTDIIGSGVLPRIQEVAPGNFEE